MSKSFKADAGGNSFIVTEGPGGSQIVNGKPWDVRILERGGLTLIWYKNALYRFRIDQVEGSKCLVWSGHQMIEIDIEDSRSRLLSQFSAIAPADHSHIDIVAPMPGLVTKIKVESGQTIEKSCGLLSLEAMKMEMKFVRRSADVSDRSTSPSAQRSTRVPSLQLLNRTRLLVQRTHDTDYIKTGRKSSSPREGIRPQRGRVLQDR